MTGRSFDGLVGSTEASIFFLLGDDSVFVAWPTASVTNPAIFVPKKKPKRLVVRQTAKNRAAANPAKSAKT
jgi:hypothetical protein